ncbi:hypothetical protein LNQ49_20050 [Flavobacterium sp. F-65]|jgi:hypothetical protein|uniref:Lipoprotein n=1 Tax=Flavobacterium pisciphilum TaxID=2893755 RepID=A0ABS8MYL9_9FLAO|nr:hypothetical protein [Flavobacterium sp. F-65]MCC9073881.1 hypothetical protein [Flavobacterium sp. F-65]
MKLTNFFKLKIVLIAFVLLGCNLKNSENPVSKHTAKNEQEKFEVDSLEVKDKEGILYTIKYYNDSIYVTQNKKNIIKIGYLNRFEKAFPVNGLIVNDKSKDCYITDSHILLLPLNEVNNRINLIAIDLINKKEISYQFKEKSDLITTAINSFYFNEKSNIIVSTNSLNYEGKTTVHYYKIGKDLITHQGSKELDLTPEMLESNEAFFKFLNTNNNNIP